MSLRIVAQDGGTRIWLKVVPGASRDRIVGVLGDALKIAVSKPPQDGAANRAVAALLASALQIPPYQVQIVHGQSNPRKEVRIIGLAPEVVAARLALS